MAEEEPIMARNEETVRAFLEGREKGDVEACTALLTEDVCWINYPLEPVRGREKVRALLASLLERGRVGVELVHLFSRGDEVITERVDRWDWDGRGAWQLELPVCGMFELAGDGRIREWREYYDNDHWSEHGGPALRA